MGELKPEDYASAVVRMRRLGGFAPGDYVSICNICDIHFHGDKRAVYCLPCAADLVWAAASRRPDHSGVVEALKGIIDDLMAQMDWVGTGSSKSGDADRIEFEDRILAALRSSATVQKGEESIVIPTKSANTTFISEHVMLRHGPSSPASISREEIAVQVRKAMRSAMKIPGPGRDGESSRRFGKIAMFRTDAILSRIGKGEGDV